MANESQTRETPGTTKRINRAAGSAAPELTLEEAVAAARQEFDEICCIIVDHPAVPEQGGKLTIRLYTGKAGLFDETVEVFDDDVRVVIERDERDDLRLPVRVVATAGGVNDVDMPGRTTVYMSEHVFGAVPLDVEDGLAYLEEKLAAPDSWEADGLGVAERLHDAH